MDYAGLARRFRDDNAATNVLFAGQSATDADHAALARAKELQESGSSRRDIWDKTGWWNDNGHWNFEISNPTAPTYTPPKFDKANPWYHLPEVSDDPALYRSYPGLTEMQVAKAFKGLIKPGQSATFVKPYSPEGPGYIGLPGRNPYPVEDQALYLQHEKQHAVDQQENVLGKWSRSGPWPTQRIERRATNAATRDLFMTPEQRAANAPWETEQASMMQHYQNTYPVDQLMAPPENILSRYSPF